MFNISGTSNWNINVPSVLPIPDIFYNVSTARSYRLTKYNPIMIILVVIYDISTFELNHIIHHTLYDDAYRLRNKIKLDFWERNTMSVFFIKEVIEQIKETFTAKRTDVTIIIIYQRASKGFQNIMAF